MNWLFITLTVAIVVASVLLTIVVLLQNGKGDGLVANFAAVQTFGVRQTADILEKITWFLVAFILVISIVTSFTTGNSGSSIDITDQIENAAYTSQPAFPSQPIDLSDPSAE